MWTKDGVRFQYLVGDLDPRIQQPFSLVPPLTEK